MRTKSDLIFQRIIDENLIVPIGKEVDCIHGVIKLNETGAFLWNILSNGDQTRDSLIKQIILKYNVTEKRAEADVDKFLKEINDIGCLE